GKVFVTGASGLIGSYAVKALYNSGYEVTALYRNVPASKKRYRWNIIETDLLESESTSILESIDTDVVVHCAAALPKQFGGEEARQAAEKNKQIDAKIINFCKDKDYNLIYTSGTSIYGVTGFPWEEESVVSPLGSYALAKFQTEQKIAELKNRSV
ncbi:unnamed protein product, partial [marine sediment metagenome]